MNRVKLLLKLANAFRRALDYQKDPDPDHWGTINGAHVHKDENGNIDGGAGGALNGKLIEKPTENANNSGQNEEKDYNKSERSTTPKKKLSPSGKNYIAVRNFGCEADLEHHVTKHLAVEKEFAGMTEAEYIQAGINLLESPVGNGIEGYMDSIGNIIRYNRHKNWLAIGNDGGLFTFYAPKTGHNFYLALRRKALQNGGKK